MQIEDLSSAYTDSVIAEALTKWNELDVDKSGSLELDELEPLWEFVFIKMCQKFEPGSKDEAEAKAAQVTAFRRFAKTTPAGESGNWTFTEFNAYFADVLIKEADEYQFNRNQAFADGDMSAAAEKFRELDKDESQFLDGKEVGLEIIRSNSVLPSKYFGH